MVKRMVWICMGWLALAPAARSQETERGGQALEQWIEVRLLLSREEQDWLAGRRVLEDRIQLLRGETGDLREKIALAQTELRASDAQLEELNARKADLRAGTADLAPALARMETDLRRLLTRSPVPIQERVRPLSQRMPADPEQTKLGLAERCQNVIGILNEINKFAREITVASEIRDLGDGQRAEVSVLYLGMGQAYYCNEKGQLAGIGRPGGAGWVWEPRNDLVEAVSAAIGVYRNERPAAYVGLPAKVGHPSPEEEAR